MMRKILLLSLIACSTLYGQPKDSFLAVGYAGNVPSELLGVSVIWLNPQIVGFYFDIKADPVILTGGDDGWRSVNAGISFVPSNHIAWYVGLGRSRSLKDGETEKAAINILFGMLALSDSRWLPQIGVEVQPFGFTLGFAYTFK